MEECYMVAIKNPNGGFCIEKGEVVYNRISDAEAAYEHIKARLINDNDVMIVPLVLSYK